MYKSICSSDYAVIFVSDTRNVWYRLATILCCSTIYVCHYVWIVLLKKSDDMHCYLENVKMAWNLLHGKWNCFWGSFSWVYIEHKKWYFHFLCGFVICTADFHVFSSWLLIVKWRGFFYCMHDDSAKAMLDNVTHYTN